jgi:hypothetical protein
VNNQEPPESPGQSDPDEPVPADDQEDEEEKPIESPFETGTIRYLKGDRERLAISLEGPAVSGGEIDLEAAAPFMNRLNLMLHALAAHVESLKIGERGKLPQLTGIGTLSFAGLSEGSAVFHFTIPPRDEQLMITASGDIATPMEEAIRLLLEIISNSTGEEAEQLLLERLRELPERVGANYSDLLDVLLRNNIETRWRTGDQQAALPAADVRRARAVLERVEIVDAGIEEHTGLLYEANAKEREFRLESDIGRTIQGTYHEDLTEIIRGAWNHRVRAKLRLTVRRLERAPASVRPAEVELLDVLEVLPDED